MEFEGRIIRVLPIKSGKGQNGNEWKRLPFVFAYFENADQRWEDKVLLETWNTNQMADIARFCEVGPDGKVIVENGNVKLKTLDIKCKCGFSHNVRDVSKRDGSGMATFNEMSCYKLEIAAETPQTPHPTEHNVFDGNGNSYETKEVQASSSEDDLPF